MENDIILLAKVKEIHQYKVVVSLPHNKTASCDITNISEKYRDLLSAIAHDGENEETDESVPTLYDLFVIGQTVHVKMMKSSNSKMNVSLLPSAINGGIGIKHLKAGMRLQAAIKSIEDKGYILETGINGINSFMPLKKSTNEPEIEYKVGQILEVSPIDSLKSTTKGQCKVLNFTATVSKTPHIITNATSIGFTNILPGMLIKTTIKPAGDGSLEAAIHGFPISIKHDHQDVDELKNPEQTIVVIGVDRENKHIDCSLLPHLLPPFKGDDELIHTQIGHSQPDCVVKIIQKHQIVFEIPSLKCSRAIVNKDHLDATLSNIKVGDKTTIRYLSFNLIDNKIIGTTLKSLLSLSYFSVHQAKVGELITGTIKGYRTNGFAVQISSQLSCFIPNLHLRDQECKTPSILYKSCDKVKCRVFHIDHEKNKLILTTKKSFLHSSLPVVSSIDDFQKGMIVDGFVAKVGDHGLLVVMFNNLKGWVRKSCVPEKDLKIAYEVGKPVQVRVLAWDKSRGRIDLSLIIEENDETVKEEACKEVVTVEVGQVFECLIKKMMKHGFNVRLLPSNKPAFLNFDQLSDSRDNRELFKSRFSQGGSVTNVVVVNIDGGLVAVSRKESLITAARNGTLLKRDDDVTIDSQWLGWVIRKESYGLFVELPTGIVGLVPLRQISQRCIDTVEIGDTVEPCVLEFDHLKRKKSLFSMLMAKTYRAKDHLERCGLAFVVNAIEERKFIQSKMSKLANISIGGLVDVVVTSRQDWGLTVSIDDSLPGFVRNEHLPDSLISETNNITKYRAVVIYIDLIQQSIEVSMKTSAVNAVSNRKTERVNIQPKQQIKSEVLSINPDFVVARLLDHANGHIVFIPTKRSWNDVAKEFAWNTNQRNIVVIKRAFADRTFLASLAINEPLDTAEGGAKPQITVKTKEKTINVNSMKDMPKKLRLVTGETYPAFFHSITKSKIFFYVTKKQRGFCNLVDYCRSLEELEQLTINPPEVKSQLPRPVTIIDNDRQRKDKLATGHFLEGQIAEGDQIIAKVLEAENGKPTKLYLPLGLKGRLAKSTATAEVGTFVQCFVEKTAESSQKRKYLFKVLNRSNNDEEEMYMLKWRRRKYVRAKREKIRKLIEERRAKELKRIKEESTVPDIVFKKKDDVVEATSLSNLYKRVHEDSDDDDEEEADSQCGDETDLAPLTKRRKTEKPKQSATERELSVRDAEKRREVGDILKNPKNETEFELLVFNYPNEASSWTRYMHYLAAERTEVDKARTVAERALKTMTSSDGNSRFVVSVAYLDLEIDQLSKNRSEDAVRRFGALFERCLLQRAKAVFAHVCGRLRSMEMFELAEKTAKKFVKDFPHDHEAWFEIVATRFQQKRFPIVKETMTNAMRVLKACDYVSLQIRLAQMEIDGGQAGRAVSILKQLLGEKPKARGRVEALLREAGLEDHIAQL